MLAYLQENWIKWVFAALLAILGFAQRQVVAKFRTEKKKTDAIAVGVQALLRESIVSAYNKYSGKGHCPIYAKESIKRAYQAYSALGGNDVAKELYRKLLEMPEEAPDHDEGGDK